MTSVDNASRKFISTNRRQLHKEHLKIIDQVRKNHDYQCSDEYDKYWMELLESRAVLQYVNGEEWYAVNPLVEIRE